MPVDFEMSRHMFGALLLIACVLNVSTFRIKRGAPPSYSSTPYVQPYLEGGVLHGGTEAQGRFYRYTTQGSPKSWTVTVYPSPSRTTRYYARSPGGYSCGRCSHSYTTYDSRSGSYDGAGSQDESLGSKNLQSWSTSPSASSWKPSFGCTSCSTRGGTPSYVGSTRPTSVTSYTYSSPSHGYQSSSSSSSSSSSWSKSYSYSESSSGSQSSSSSSYSSSSGSGAPTIIETQTSNNVQLLSPGSNTWKPRSCAVCSSNRARSLENYFGKEMDSASSIDSSWAPVSQLSSFSSSSQGSSASNIGSSIDSTSERTGNQFGTQVADSQSKIITTVGSSYGRPAFIQQREISEPKIDDQVPPLPPTFDQVPPLPPTDQQLISKGCVACSTNSKIYSYGKPVSPSSSDCIACLRKGKINPSDFVSYADTSLASTGGTAQIEVAPASKTWEYLFNKFRVFSKVKKLK